MSYPKPDVIGVWLVKWIVGLFIIIGLIAWVIQFEVMKYKCQRMAEKRGYIESTYIAVNRAGFGEQCICRKKRNPDGTIDERAKLVIDID